MSHPGTPRPTHFKFVFKYDNLVKLFQQHTCNQWTHISALPFPVQAIILAIKILSLTIKLSQTAYEVSAEKGFMILVESERN